jgi:ribosome biogenesis GTPase
VRTDDQTVDCAIRGVLKKERGESDLVAVGDRVRWVPVDEGTGLIEEVLPRKTVLSRSPPPSRPQVEQIIVANPDQVVAVFSMGTPPPNPLMIDRYLVACEAVELPVILVMNKVDLGTQRADWELPELYRGIGYPVYLTSIVTGAGLEALREALRGKLSVLTGPSGTGKSSLLNALWPQLERIVGDVSEYHDRGRHTTVVAELLEPEPETFVADTPGLRTLRFWDIDPEQLEAFFPEMLPYLNQCRFTPCTHTHEPGCAVKAAVERGEIAAQRYDSYLRMFASDF